MRIAHITNTIFQQGGGISSVVANITRTQKHSGHEVIIWIFATNKSQALKNIFNSNNRDLINEIKVVTFKDLVHSFMMLFFRRTSSLRVKINSFDVIHRHGLWSPISLLNFLIEKNNNNFFISPHGLLNKEAMKISRIKKNIFIWIIEKVAFNKSSAFIASTDFEKLEILKFKWAKKKNIIIIPNGVDDIFFKSETNVANQKIKNKKKQFLYLGAIERIKGIAFLVKAIQQNSDIMRKNGYSLLCVGDGNKAYKKEIADFIDLHNLHDIVKFKSGVYGNERIDLYQESKFFISMSYSENFGITIAESLVLGVPVIVSSALPWRFLEDIKAGIIVNPEYSSIKMGIITACKMTEKKYLECSNNAVKFSKEKYRWNIIGKKMVETYKRKDLY